MLLDYMELHGTTNLNSSISSPSVISLSSLKFEPSFQSWWYHHIITQSEPEEHFDVHIYEFELKTKPTWLFIAQRTVLLQHNASNVFKQEKKDTTDVCTQEVMAAMVVSLWWRRQMCVWFHQTADNVDDKMEGHKECCDLLPTFSSPPPLSGPDRGDTGSRVFVMGCWQRRYSADRKCVYVFSRSLWAYVSTLCMGRCLARV